MSDRIGLFTGSFDPITNGHVDLIERASQLFDVFYVGIFFNPNKAGLLNLNQREKMVKASLSHLPNVQVITSSQQLVVTVAREYGVTHLVRGLRNGADLEYEASFDFYNRELAPELETVYLLAKPQFKFVSSSQVRELLHFQEDISPYVPAPVSKEFSPYETTKLP